MDVSKIQGWVLRNEKYASGYINGDSEDVCVNDKYKARGNVRLSIEGPNSYWDILPISTYHPEWVLMILLQFIF